MNTAPNPFVALVDLPNLSLVEITTESSDFSAPVDLRKIVRFSF